MSRATFSGLHVDVARFATDDFNPFHDRHKWHRLAGNPFGGPIVLGFQLTAYALHATCALHPGALPAHRYLHLRVSFADAVRTEESVELTIKPAQEADDGAVLSHRIALRGPRGLALTGHVRFLQRDGQAASPPVMPLSLNRLRDRTDVPGTDYFLKRKFMTTANAKNFLLGACIDPADYFDELEERVHFMPMFPASLLSCALLERGHRLGYDFLREPMVYAFHDVLLDRDVARRLRSNDTLNMLVSAERTGTVAAATAAKRAQRIHHCLGYTGQGECLYRAEIGLVPLAALLDAGKAPGSSRCE